MKGRGKEIMDIKGCEAKAKRIKIYELVLIGLNNLFLFCFVVLFIVSDKPNIPVSIIAGITIIVIFVFQIILAVSFVKFLRLPRPTITHRLIKNLEEALDTSDLHKDETLGLGVYTTTYNKSKVIILTPSSSCDLIKVNKKTLNNKMIIKFVYGSLPDDFKVITKKQTYTLITIFIEENKLSYKPLFCIQIKKSCIYPFPSNFLEEKLGIIKREEK